MVREPRLDPIHSCHQVVNPQKGKGNKKLTLEKQNREHDTGAETDSGLHDGIAEAEISL